MQRPNLHYASVRKSTPWPLLAIVLTFVIPFIVACLLYQFHEKVTLKSVQAGQLVTPPLPINNLSALAALSHSTRKWQLVHLEPTSCDVSCRNRADMLKRIQQALGKDQNRLQLQSLRFTPALHQIAIEGSILLIDPKGFLVMVYPPASFNAKGLLEDMRRLLRFSHIG